MKKLIIFLSVLLIMGMSCIVSADTKQPVKKSSRALEGTVQHRG
jgi:hypothetical protein